MRSYLIIGTGAAGVSAAEAIRCQDPRAKILLVGEEPQGYYSRPGLAFYLTGELDERQLHPFTEQDFRRLDVRILQARATRIHPHSHSVEMHNGSTLSYDQLLIATGAEAARMQVTGGGVQGVVKLDNLEDAQHLIKLMRKARSAVVVGGGITALEIVEGLVAKGVKTHFFLRGDRYWSNVLDETESRIVEHRLQDEGVTIHHHTELAEILEKRGRVAGVRAKDGRLFKCDLVAIAIGIRPRKELAEVSGLEADRGIVVNEYLQTSDPDIYAAGDVAQVFDPFTGKSVLDSLWGPAREQGTTAGLNMCGLRQPYYKLVPFNVTRLANLTTTIIGLVGHGSDQDLVGIARGESETWRQLPDAIAAQADFDVNRLRILVGERTFIGAIVMGDQTLSRPLHQIITQHINITPIREKLLKPGAPIADIIADFWTEFNQAELTS
jgi:NADPH-dependent 2,4-dienoyl-CoA reductase/sulfur reductase-like enzyme